MARKFLRWLPFGLLVSAGSPALADCEADAWAAFAKILSNGPYYSSVLEWGGDRNSAENRTVVPGLGELRKSDNAGPSAAGEILHIGRQLWTRKSGADWVGPASTGQWHSPRDDRALDGDEIGRADCRTTGKGKVITNVFEVDVLADGVPPTIDRLFVSPRSGLPLRRERTWASGGGGSVTIYRFDGNAALPTPSAARENGKAIGPTPPTASPAEAQ